MGSRSKAAAAKRAKALEWANEQAEAESPEGKAAAARVATLEAENARLAKLLGLVETYHAGAGTAPSWMRPAKRSKPGSATACMQLSDLHLDECVNPAEVGGLNAYNREIAELRLKRWADKACDMGDMHRHDWDGAVIFWGGDMVSGSIHEELRETNDDVLPGTVVHWAPRIAAAIKQVADFYGRVHVPAVVGNHGRLTIKMPAKRRGRNSWDWLLVNMVAAHFKDDPRVTFDIAQGSYLFVPVYEDHVYLTHGDEVGGGSGWSGVWTPLMTLCRKGAEMAAAHGIRVAYATVGHWHQACLAHARGVSLNSSLKGWDEYAAAMRFKPEAASQNWFTHTRKHGVTLAGVLFVADKAREGW